MDFYFMQAPTADEWVTAMERDLIECAASFKHCVFDEGSLARLVGFIQMFQDERLMDHPERSPVPVRLSKGKDGSLWLAIGRCHVHFPKIQHFYAEPRKQTFQSE